MATGTLEATTIAARYKSLLKLTGTANDVLGDDHSAKYIEDGDGNDSILSLSTNRVGIGTTTPAQDLDIRVPIHIGVDNAGCDVKFFGDTSTRYMEWDQSADALVFTDSAKIIIGTGLDIEIYHDGSNSYIENKTGELRLATVSSGIAVSIGHTTSETTVNDNLTVIGDTILDNTSIGGLLTTTNPSVFNESGLAHDFRVESVDNEYMIFVDGSANKVGINTDAPTEILEIANGELCLHNNDGGSISDTDVLGTIVFKGTHNSAARHVAKIVATAQDAWTDNANNASTKLQFFTQDFSDTNTFAIPRLTIAENGHIGIGVNEPAVWDSDSNYTVLQIGSSTCLVNVGTDPAGQTFLTNNMYWEEVSERWEFISAGSSGSEASYILQNDDGNIYFNVSNGSGDAGVHVANNVAAMTILNTAYVGIGTVTPTVKFVVFGAHGTGMGDDYVASFQNDDTTDGAKGVHIRGGVGSGAILQLENEAEVVRLKVEANGEVQMPATYSLELSNSPIEMEIDASGRIGIDQVGGPVRYKTNIRDLDYNFINDLRPILFDRLGKDEDAKPTSEIINTDIVGLVAEEVALLDKYKQIVVYNSDGETLAIKYKKLIPYMIKSIQELSAKVEALENA